MNNETISFFVSGVPAPEGSMNSYGKGRMVPTNYKKLKPWRESIAEGFKTAYPNYNNGIVHPQFSPVKITMIFYLPKAKSCKLAEPTMKRADLDKLERAVNDSLTGLAWFDDCQVVEINSKKVFGIPGVQITIEGL